MIEIYNTLTSFFQEGGLFMYPIAFVLAIGLAISAERWAYLTFERSRNIRAFDNFLPLLRTSDIEKMHMFARENQAPVTRIIACGLDMIKVSRQRADVEHAMNEGMIETMPRLDSRIGYLSVLANVATLLGLLGTIVGLISAFTAVANANPAEKSALLSSSISVAMNTTAFGLVAAIPLMVLHAVLQNKVGAIVTSIQMSSVKFLNIMTLYRFIEAGAPRAESPAVQHNIAMPVAGNPLADATLSPVGATLTQA